MVLPTDKVLEEYTLDDGTPCKVIETADGEILHEWSIMMEQDIIDTWDRMAREDGYEDTGRYMGIKLGEYIQKLLDEDERRKQIEELSE
jgi:hypothetical protein